MGLQESAGLGWAGLGEWASSSGPAGLGLSVSWAQGWVLCSFRGPAEGEKLTGKAWLRVRAEVPEGKPNLASRSRGAACIMSTHILLAKTHGVPVIKTLSSKFTVPDLLWDNGLGSLFLL